MTITKNCKKHGDLTEKDIIKKGKLKSGNQAYRCKKCMQDLHANNYQANKEKIRLKLKKYKEENLAKFKQIKKECEQKYRERDRDKKRERDKRLYLRQKEIMSDRYIKHLIAKRSLLKFKDIPPSLIEFKKVLLRTKLIIKQHKKEDKNDN